MDDHSESNFSKNYLTVLKKITTSESKGLDNSYLEKLLSNLRIEYDETNKYFTTPEVTLWLSDTLKFWKTQAPSVPVAAFMCQFIGILSKKEDRFKQVQSTLDDLCNPLFPIMHSNVPLKVAFLKFLNDAATHKAGCQWINSTEHWRIVIKWCLTDNNFYVDQEGLNLLKKLIKEASDDGRMTKEIFQEITNPLAAVITTNGTNEHMYSTISSALHLVQEVLKIHITAQKDNFILELSKMFHIEKVVKFILENCPNERILESAACVYVLNSLLKYHDKEELLSIDHIPSEVLDLFIILLEQNQINCILKVSKFCQLLWSDMRKHFNCESRTVLHFIIFQLIPSLCFKGPPESKIFDSLLQKLFNLTSQSTQKFSYSFRDKIRKREELKNWSLKAINCVTSHFDCLTQDEAVVIFQCLAHALHLFLPEINSDQEMNYCENNKLKSEINLCEEHVPLLSAVLNSLSTLIEKFKINWVESLESLCLVKITCELLKNTDLPCIVVVQILLLVKLAIINNMSLDLAFLLNDTENSSLKCLLPLLYKHMHNPSWEIRDSCIEVITTITGLAESKYPSFQLSLLERDFCHLMYDIMNDDSESYVRASAIRCLAAMIKIEKLSASLGDLDLTTKIIHLLKVESEGIVRREAVLLLKQVYLNSNLRPDLCESFYEIMTFTATCDLHWEVKVNSLLFWQAVIQRIFADQGMIDGSFPKVTFSKENKKIVTLTNDEIKLRLSKALTQLSRIGCLHVILSAMYDECDFQVVEKSVEILIDFLAVLKRYGIIKARGDQPSNRALPIKRKHTDFQSPEMSKSVCKVVADDDDGSEMKTAGVEESRKTSESDAVIEEIVNEMDINLLVSVQRSKERETQEEKKLVLQEVKPEIFLMQMQDFECDKFLEDKKKWLTNSNDLKSLINDIILVKSGSETNLMDCY
ncbi:hypothetical protein RUM43_004522 [Polyplax serrata]|uniref:BRCA1-associated ATM activator 1 n=1 Tax=Polyplax serrata TaxID=468196 RepID=A0AAN8SBU1_POLSC